MMPRKSAENPDARVRTKRTVNHGQPRREWLSGSRGGGGGGGGLSRRTKHLLIAQLLNPVAQLGSKCLYVLQSKAREGGGGGGEAGSSGRGLGRTY